MDNNTELCLATTQDIVNELKKRHLPFLMFYGDDLQFFTNMSRTDVIDIILKCYEEIK